MTLDQAASDEYFPGHGCLTGDCPHEKYIGCFTGAFKAGHAFALKSPEVPEIQKLFNQLIPEEQAFILDKIQNLLRS